MGSISFLRLDLPRKDFLCGAVFCTLPNAGTLLGDGVVAAFVFSLLGGGNSENSGVIETDPGEETDGFLLEDRRE